MHYLRCTRLKKSTKRCLATLRQPQSSSARRSLQGCARSRSLAALSSAPPLLPLTDMTADHLPRIKQQATPAASAELRNASNGPRRLPISSLLNPTPSAPRSFPTYQQEPPTPPSDPSRAPRRRGLGRWLVAPRPRRDGPAVAGVKRGRDGGEASATKSGRRRSVCSDSTPASGNASGVGRPLMPTIVVEDWPESVIPSHPSALNSLTGDADLPSPRVRLNPVAQPVRRRVNDLTLPSLQWRPLPRARSSRPLARGPSRAPTLFGRRSSAACRS